VKQTLICNGTIVNEGKSYRGSILINGSKIERIYSLKDKLPEADTIIDAEGKLVIPGVIDDQVHFREPGSTHKGSIVTESAAAVLGGITSYMDMPNNTPAAITIEAIEAKNSIAKSASYANFSFYLGATNDNIEEIKKANPQETCGVKVFMGSSTGNMLVDNEETLNNIFKESKLLIATHCESEPIIKQNLKEAKEKYGEMEIPFSEHCNIRSREACIESSKHAISLAQKYNSRLHILHISTEEETLLIEEASKISPKITAEACVHYMLLDSSMYNKMGSKMKCNPAIKEKRDREAIIKAVKNGVIKVVATDHAPHTLDEKQNNYLNAPSGLPLVQHSLQIMLEMAKEGVFSIEEVVDRMAHSPAINFKVSLRGFIREGYFADIVIVDPNKKDSLTTTNPAYHCKWSPFEGKVFNNSIVHTFVNGIQVVALGQLTGKKAGTKLLFNYGV